MDNKQRAQQRADQAQAFYDEVKQLEADEVLQLNQDQRQSIAHYHEGLLKSVGSDETCVIPFITLYADEFDV